jgi:hypothetical protein
MLPLILLLASTAPPQQAEQAFIRSCDMTAAGWVCRYSLPAVAAVPAPFGETTADDGPPEPGRLIPADAGSPPVAVAPNEPAAEAEARLILRCAEASWLSLCLPGERRQARRLRDAALAREALKLQVTRLLSEDRCDEAVRAALVGGDLDLARQARAFCVAGPAG